MEHVNIATVSLCFNVLMLIVQLHTNARVAELKVYMHEKFVMKSNNA